LELFTPHASSVLDVASTNNDVLFPRMTTTQRAEIAGPAQGLMVYDTDNIQHWIFNGGWHGLLDETDK
jgi:hypothetical protein